MNFHPDKQLFQVVGARDRTTDPWITRPELYPYTMGDSLLGAHLKDYQNKAGFYHVKSWLKLYNSTDF